MANTAPHSDPDKTKVQLDLLTVNNEAYAILAAFGKAARRQGFNADWMDCIRTEAISRDYNHLLSTVMDNVEDPED